METKQKSLKQIKLKEKFRNMHVSIDIFLQKLYGLFKQTKFDYYQFKNLNTVHSIHL